MSRHHLIVNATFSGSHYLPGYDGPCERMHGHNFRVQARVSGDQLDELGMLLDFKSIRQMLGRIIERFDHQIANEVPPFDKMNPTAENMTRFIYEQLAPSIEQQGAKLESISLWETENYCAIYQPED